MFELHLSFSDIFSVVTDWINILISASTLGVAIYALNTWKKEKVYDIDTEATAMIGKAHISIENVLTTASDINLLDEYGKSAVSAAMEKDSQLGDYMAATLCHFRREDNLDEMNNDLLSLSIKVMRESQDKNIVEFYRYFYFVKLKISLDIKHYFADAYRRRELELGLTTQELSLSDYDYSMIKQNIDTDFKSVRDHVGKLSSSITSKFMNRNL